MGHTEDCIGEQATQEFDLPLAIFYFINLFKLLFSTSGHILSPASEASRKVANLTERKNLHTPYMVSKNLSICQSVCLSVCLSVVDIVANGSEVTIF